MIFINQVTGPLFIDVVNAFAEKIEKPILITGQIEKVSKSISPNVKIFKFIEYKRNSAFFRLLTWALFTLRTFFTLFFLDKTKKLFLVSNPPFAPIIGYLFYKFFKQEYNILIYDLFPDALISFNYIKESSLIFKTWANLNSKIFSNANKVFTISECMADKIKKYYHADNLVVINNWADTDFIKPIPKDKNWFADKYNQKNKFTILYSGNFGITHKIETIFNVAANLREIEDINFLIIGDGAKKKLLENLKEKYRLENIIMLPFQDAEIFPYSLNCGDVGVVVLDNGVEGLSVPSKTYSSMAAGQSLLILSDVNSEVARLCEKYQMGRSFNPDNVSQITAYLIELYNNPELLNEQKKNSRNASQHFTPDKAKEYLRYVS